MKSVLKVTAAAVATIVLSSAMANAAAVAGTFVTDPSQVATAPVDATSTSTAASDAVSLRLANDATNVYVYLTYNSAIDGGTYVAIDSDNNPSTGYAIFGSTAIGANLGIQYGTGFTETASSFNTDPGYYGAGSGSVTPATFAEATTATTILYTLPLSTLQADADTGGYTGLDLPGTFTLETYQDSGNVLGPVTYTLGTPVAVPEPASLSLLALAAAPMLRRRAKRA